jgi:threonyl-tRNA synthetase
MVILGAKEVENNQVSIRRHTKRDIGSVPSNQFTADVLREINEKSLPSESIT